MEPQDEAPVAIYGNGQRGLTRALLHGAITGLVLSQYFINPVCFLPFSFRVRFP